MARTADGPLYGQRVNGSTFVEALSRGGPLQKMAQAYGVTLLDPTDPANIVPADVAQLVASVVTNWIVVRSNQSADVSLVYADRLLYIDPNTWNADFDGKYIQVILPDHSDEIFSLLNKRRDVSKRNFLQWEGETVETIRAENADKGIN